MSEFFAILNGAAGGGRCRSRADVALQELRAAGVDAEVHLTTGPGHATDLAADAYQKGQRNFLSIGGDGTAFEVVNGLFANGTPNDVRLGMLPLGTGNSFLRDFGIEGPVGASEAITAGSTKPVDVICAEHADGTLHYINTMGIGFVAKVGALTNERLKPLGTAGYVAAVLASVATLEYPVDPIAVDGKSEVDRRPAAFLSFSNSKFTGGAMKIAPEADVRDGKLDIIRVGQLTRLPFFSVFPKIFTGSHVDHPLIEQTQANEVDFVEQKEQPVLIDGELFHLALKKLSVLPSAIEVYA